MSFADHYVPQFRRIAQERLDRVEAAWQSVLTSVNDEASARIHREIHTLKGESRMMGFTDVHLVCHKLEDLLEVARTRGYAIDDDFDLAVNMALRFLGMLVRKKVGAELSGIDLPGFVRQIDAIVAETRSEVSRDDIRQLRSPKPAAAAARISPELRVRLSSLAVDMFIEYSVAQGTRRNRLRASWHSLRELIGLQRAVIGPAQLARHEASARTLARDLDKPTEVIFEVETAEVTVEILEASEVAILHLVSNAIDHGIETTAIRAACAKPAVASIRISSAMRDGLFVFSVQDDGGGIDFPGVQARAIELGLLEPDITHTFDDERWIELMCHPGLSTRRQATDISGRGAGLNAVRTTISDVGGKLTMASRQGVGTTWMVRIPLPAMSIQTHVFRAPGLPFPIAIDATWAIVPDREVRPVIDLASHFGIPTASAFRCATFVRGDQAISFLAEQSPTTSVVRRLVVTPVEEAVELITQESIEGVLVRPERFLAAPSISISRTSTDVR